MRFEDIKRHLSVFRVGIAGAGGLGSNCAVALARSGVGTLVVADYDKVELRNLNRQYYFTGQAGMMKVTALRDTISAISPSATVITYAERLNKDNIPGIFAGCDVIVEAFDSAEMKEIIAEVVQLRMKGVPLVMGSGMAGFGNNDTIRYRKIDDMLYICGDENTVSDEDNPPMAPRVGIVANMQANTVIEILMQMD